MTTDRPPRNTAPTEPSTANSPAFQSPRIAAGASLGPAEMLQELIYMIECLCDALQATATSKILRDYERQLSTSEEPPATSPQDHYHYAKELCAQAKSLVAIARM